MEESEKKLRRSAKIRFTRKHEEFNEYYRKEKRSDAVTVAKYEEVAESWRNLEQRHDSYLMNVDDADIATEEKWIREARCMYDDVIEKHDAMGLGVKKSNDRIVIDLEKTRLPRFTGSIRDYPRFKSDFQKYIEPNLPSSIVAYTLRTCLSKDAAHRVRNTDDIQEMWKLLDEKYADSAALADMILDDIRRTRKFRDNETQRFVEFVDKVEDGYHDLCILGLQREITTTSSVSEIEQKLSPEMSIRWARTVVSEPTFDKTNKLPSLLTFLRCEKGSIEYRCAGLRANYAERVEGTVQHIDISEVKEVHERLADEDRASTASKTCLIHRASNHLTCNCEKYRSKTVEQRFELMRQKAACWSCLIVGHRFKDCTRKRICGEGGCRRRHHRSLHIDNTQKDDLRVNHVTLAREICNGHEIKGRPSTKRACQDETATPVDGNRSKKQCTTVYEDGYIEIERNIQKEDRNFGQIMELERSTSHVRSQSMPHIPGKQGFTNPYMPRNVVSHRTNMYTPFYRPACCSEGTLNDMRSIEHREPWK